MKRYLLIASGCLLLALGAVGILVPVLPTTPFVLLAATCFSVSSPRAYRFLLRSRFFGPYIEHYRTGVGISRAAKVRAILVLWALLGISVTATRKLWLALVLAVVGIAVTIHLLMIRSKANPSRGAGDSGSSVPEDGG